MEGGPSRDRKGQTFLESNDKCKINVSLTLSNSSLESKTSSPESVNDNNPHQHMENRLETPAAASSTSTSSSSIYSAVTVEGSRRSSSNGSGGETGGGSGAASMVLAGCPRCLMYVMLWEKNPRCPRCNSSTLLNIFNGH